MCVLDRGGIVPAAHLFAVDRTRLEPTAMVAAYAGP
jgi:hypothetical protein